MSLSDAAAERADILDTYNKLQTEEQAAQEKTQKSTQWGPAGAGATMTCGNTNPCSMFHGYASNPSIGHCDLGWTTRRQYVCNEWQPEGTLPTETDESAGDVERWPHPRA